MLIKQNKNSNLASELLRGQRYLLTYLASELLRGQRHLLTYLASELLTYFTSLVTELDPQTHTKVGGEN